MTEVEPQTPPQAIEAEEAILGGLLLGARRAIDTARAELDPADFYRESHAAIFAACLALDDRGVGVDAIAVTAELERQGQLADAGGRARIRELAALVPATANAAHWAKLVRDAAVLRRLIGVGGQIARLGWEGVGEVDDLVREAEESLFGLRSDTERRRVQVSRLVDLVVELEAQWKDPPDEGELGPPTPWPRYLGSFRKGSLVTIGGRTGSGKTIMGVLCSRAIAETGEPGCLVTIEMPSDQITDRIVSSYGVPHDAVMTRRVPSHLEPQFRRAVGEAARLPLEIIDEPSIDARRIWTYQRLRRYSFVVIDHLHRIDLSGGRWDDYRLRLEAEVRTLATMAREENIVVVLLAQLKGAEGRDPNPKPRLGDLRETRVIEQESAVVWGTWVGYDREGRPNGEAELAVLKNRHGAAGAKVFLQFVPREVRFDLRPGAQPFAAGGPIHDTPAPRATLEATDQPTDNEGGETDAEEEADDGIPWS